MFERHGTLIVAMVIIASLVYVQQGILALQVSPVAFRASQSVGYYIELPASLTASGLEQVVHVNSSQDLLAYICDDTAIPLLQVYLQQHKLCSGQRIVFGRGSLGGWLVRIDFMSAERRLTLGVPLHPDQMSRSDWLALPGVGTRIAQKIVENQESYGDFYTFDALKRVNGIGAKTLDRWRPFF